MNADRKQFMVLLVLLLTLSIPLNLFDVLEGRTQEHHSMEERLQKRLQTQISICAISGKTLTCPYEYQTLYVM